MQKKTGEKIHLWKSLCSRGEGGENQGFGQNILTSDTKNLNANFHKDKKSLAQGFFTSKMKSV